MGLWDSIKRGSATVGNFVTGGGEERRRSERIVRWAKDDEIEAKRRLEEKRESTNSALKTLGRLRKSVHEGAITDFVKLYETIAAISKQEFSKLDGSVDKGISANITKILPAPGAVKEMMLGGSVGAVGGAAAAYGAYGLAGIVGTASTGTAISSLGGVAATNATLAWLGGGATAAGGLGTLGGAAVLSGIAIIPAAIVAMYFGSNAAKKKLNEARNFSDEMDVFIAQCDTFIVQLDQIEQAANLLYRTILSLATVVKIQNNNMRLAIELTINRARQLQDCLGLELVDSRGQYDAEIRSAYQAMSSDRPIPSQLSLSDEGPIGTKQPDVVVKHSKILANTDV